MASDNKAPPHDKETGMINNVKKSTVFLKKVPKCHDSHFILIIIMILVSMNVSANPINYIKSNFLFLFICQINIISTQIEGKHQTTFVDVIP